MIAGKRTPVLGDTGLGGIWRHKGDHWIVDRPCPMIGQPYLKRSGDDDREPNSDEDSNRVDAIIRRPIGLPKPQPPNADKEKAALQEIQSQQHFDGLVKEIAVPGEAVDPEEDRQINVRD